MEVLKNPEELEQLNRQIMIRNLEDVYNSVEKLIQRTYANKEADLNFKLRNIRTSVSQLLTDIKNKDLDAFSGKKGTLGEFYRAEDVLLSNSSKMSETFTSTISSTDKIDIFLLEGLLDRFKKDFNNRIIVDKDILNEFKLKKMEISSADRVMSGEIQVSAKKKQKTQDKKGTGMITRKSGTSDVTKSIMAPSFDAKENAEYGIRNEAKDEIDTNILSKLYNYMNILENKYSTYQPEVSFDGEYIGDKKWKVKMADKYISGTIVDKIIHPVIIYETYWHPFDDLRTIIDFVQKEANSIPGGQYKSLCLVNSKWENDINEWARNYVHPRLVLYLYDPGRDKITYNRNVKNADRTKVWHNLDTYQKIENDIKNLIEQEDTFDESDVTDRTGLNTEGAKKFLSSMIAENKIIDVGFGTSRYSGVKINK